MDDVKVHYNSHKPAQLQAHAYAQGTDIHLAPGQEQHLPHEAWHVVQQKQGRVQPTMQMKGKVNINDDKGLEKEADIMGQKALYVPPKENTNKLATNGIARKNNDVVQRIIKMDFWGEEEEDTESYKAEDLLESLVEEDKGKLTDTDREYLKKIEDDKKDEYVFKTNEDLDFSYDELKSHIDAYIKNREEKISEHTPTGGLAEEGVMKTLVSEALSYWRENPKNSITEFINHWIGKINKHLPHNMSHQLDDTIEDIASFAHGSWTMTINLKRVVKNSMDNNKNNNNSKTDKSSQISELSQDNIKMLVTAIYHESRHADQYSTVARMHAGKDYMNQDVIIGSSIDLPSSVVKAALKSPLKDDGKPETRKIIKDAEEWNKIFERSTNKKKSDKPYYDYTQASRLFFRMRKGLQRLKKKGHEKGTKNRVIQISNYLYKSNAFTVRKHLEEAKERIAKEKSDDLLSEVMVADANEIIGILDALYKELDIQKESEKPVFNRLNDLISQFAAVSYRMYSHRPHEKDALKIGYMAGDMFQELIDGKETAEPKKAEDEKKAEEEENQKAAAEEESKKKAEEERKKKEAAGNKKKMMPANK